MEGSTSDRQTQARTPNLERRQNQRIDELRAIMKPSPVRLHHVPDWFRLVLLRHVGCRWGNTQGCAVLSHAQAALGLTWMDHWGSTPFRDTVAFVSEPYQLSRNEVESIDDLAKLIGCHWHICPNSWWYPGSTLRVLMFQEERPV